MSNREFTTGARRDTAEGKQSVWRGMWEAFFKIADIHDHGDLEYGEGNWRKGQPASQVFSSLQRHLIAWFTGEDYDKKSKLYHLLHAGWNMLFLIHMFVIYRGHYEELDDRMTFKGDWLNPNFARTNEAELRSADRKTRERLEKDLEG